MTNDIQYQYESDLTIEEIRELYNASTLGARRPMDDPAIVAAMFRHANLVVTAREGPRLVGIARSLTDFEYVAYLSDLAVRASHQHRGIGTTLIAWTRERMGSRSTIVLLSAPAAVGYYPRLGFTPHDSAWILKRHDPFPVSVGTP